MPNILALKITEVELNPQGTDLGNEWVELYSEQEVNLEEYFLENNDGETYNLSSTFSSYLIINFDSQWLDNSDEKVILKKDSEIIDETILLNDNKNNNLSWSKCNGEWSFTESTKENENNCAEDEPPKIEETSEKIAEEETKELDQTTEQINPSKTKLSQTISDAGEKITLNSPIKESSKSFVTKQEKSKMKIVYAFTLFTVIITILLALRKL